MKGFPRKLLLKQRAQGNSEIGYNIFFLIVNMCKKVVSDIVFLLLVLLLLLLWMSLQPNIVFIFFLFKVSDMSTLRETNRRLFLFTLHLRIIAEKRYN